MCGDARINKFHILLADIVWEPAPINLVMWVTAVSDQKASDV